MAYSIYDLLDDMSDNRFRNMFGEIPDTPEAHAAAEELAEELYDQFMECRAQVDTLYTTERYVAFYAPYGGRTEMNMTAPMPMRKDGTPLPEVYMFLHARRQPGASTLLIEYELQGARILDMTDVELLGIIPKTAVPCPDSIRWIPKVNALRPGSIYVTPGLTRPITMKHFIEMERRNLFYTEFDTESQAEPGELYDLEYGSGWYGHFVEIAFETPWKVSDTIAEYAFQFTYKGIRLRIPEEYFPEEALNTCPKMMRWNTIALSMLAHPKEYALSEMTALMPSPSQLPYEGVKEGNYVYLGMPVFTADATLDLEYLKPRS